MADRYAQLTRSPLRPALRRLGLPAVPQLSRRLGSVQEGGLVAVGRSAGGRFGDGVAGAVQGLGCRIGEEGEGWGAIYDASGLAVLVTRAAEACAEAKERAAQLAVEGFARSLGKELGRRGITVNTVAIEPGGEVGLEAALGFLLSGRSAYLSGQVLRLGKPTHRPTAPTPPLAGKRAVVTGAARGIGAAILSALAREGAEVVGVDVAGAAEALAATVAAVGGRSATVDVTAADAGKRLLEACEGRIDVIVHNAGITRDRTLGRMDEQRFATVLAVNAAAVERIDEQLLAEGAIGEGGRIICLSSIAGIAGNAGQTNYATAKAYLIGHVQALAAEVAGRGATINALAPGFIETQMTAAMPLGVREVGRRLNSLLQGGLPQDVAEVAAWLADPRSATINGAVVRVCGQSFLGA